MGSGMGIITFLWFGGIELINHWVLRLYLSMFGIFPLRIRSWLRHAENLALIRRSGASIKFIIQRWRIIFILLIFKVRNIMKRMLNQQEFH